MDRNRGKSEIRKAFTGNLVSFVLVPVLVVFSLCYAFIYRNFHSRAMGNIQAVHESFSTLLEDEVASLSMELASLIYANNSAIFDYIVACDTDDPIARYNAFQRLDAMLDYALQPEGSSILSMIFRFSSGRSVSYVGDLNFSLDASVRHRTSPIEEDIVYVNAFRSGSYERLYTGLGENQLVYSAVVYPSWMLDRGDDIVSIELVAVSDLSQEMSKYDTAYALGNNSIGYSCLVDDVTGAILSGSRIDAEIVRDWEEGHERFGLTYVTTPVEAGEIDATFLTVVRTSDVTGSFLIPIIAGIGLVLVVILFLWTFSHLLIKNIISPVARLSHGLKDIEDGNMDTVLEEEGYEEVARTIASFNGMVRHQRALIEDYKNRLRREELRPERLFSAYVSHNLKDEDVEAADRELFSRPHSLFAIYTGNMESFDESGMYRCLDMDLHFASQCHISPDPSGGLYHVYRRDERETGCSDRQLIASMMEAISSRFQSRPVIVTGRLILRLEQSRKAFALTARFAPILPLLADGTIVDRDSLEETWGSVVPRVPSFHRLACALYIADEAVVAPARAELAASMLKGSVEEARAILLALASAFARRLGEGGGSLTSFYGHNPEFARQVETLGDQSSAVLFLNSQTSEVMERSRQSLDLDKCDAVTRARRYICDNYHYADLSLEMVAEHVDLNARYLSTRFTKEVGESFHSYLTHLRIGKAKELLRGSTLRIYEVATLCGYASAENFNKAFRKEEGVSPMQYRKSGKNEEMPT